MRRALSPTRADVFGLVVVAGWLVWVVTSAALNGRPAPFGSTFVVAPLVVVLGVAIGRLAGTVHRADHNTDQLPSPPGQNPLSWLRAGGRWLRTGGRWLDAVVLLFVVLLLPGTPLRIAPGPAPLGYENANTAAATQIMMLCGLLLLTGDLSRRRRALLLAAACVAAGAGVARGSVAGIVVLVPAALAVAVAVVRPYRRVWWAIVLGLVSLAGAVAALLRLATSEPWPDVAVSSLSDVRRVLWDRALTLWATDPLIGAGPGSFVDVNPYAPDTDLLPVHSSLLQVLSELGLVGAALLALLVLAGYVIGATKAPALAVLTTAAWTALWIHSLVDHLFTFPALGLLAGIVIGFSGSATQNSSTQNSSMSPRVSVHALGSGGDDASGRVVNRGPAPGIGMGMRPASGPVRRPIA
ncbi:MAG TPA: O-antigen ligase family protein [Propionibacteriaceae bacterium]|nr:O-antigen ligase family protein [Propionibacteriaceae bacterium]